MSENQDAAQLVSIVERIVRADDVDVDVVRFSQGNYQAEVDFEEDEFRLYDDSEVVCAGGLHAFRD